MSNATPRPGRDSVVAAAANSAENATRTAQHGRSHLTDGALMALAMETYLL